jgi:hypothetical protein
MALPSAGGSVWQPLLARCVAILADLAVRFPRQDVDDNA